MAQYAAVAEAFRLAEKQVGLLRKVVLKRSSTSGKMIYKSKAVGAKRSMKVAAKKR